MDHLDAFFSRHGRRNYAGLAELTAETRAALGAAPPEPPRHAGKAAR
jgi:hypothetical protein